MCSLILCQFFMIAGAENSRFKPTSPLLRSFLSSCPTVFEKLPLNPYRTCTHPSHSAQATKLSIIDNQRNLLNRFICALPPLEDQLSPFFRHLLLIPVITVHAATYEHMYKTPLNFVSLFMLGMIAKTGLDMWKLEKEDSRKLENWRFSQKAFNGIRMFWNQEKDLLTRSSTPHSLHMSAYNTSAFLEEGLNNGTIVNITSLVD